MKYHIIGAAGHVDHGKTTLIKALTGMETSHLEEEKRRGITIDLGFAWLDLPDGGRAGIVDVPGHERFVKNMLAGAGGMDLVLLVVAADEGIMPQTREHLDILSLLDVQRGIIVLTKTDLVDEDWLEMVQEEVREAVQGSFLAQAPILPVSSVTGQGVEALRTQVIQMLGECGASREDWPVRLPIDRVFSVDGFGTVVTGTMTEGFLIEGQEVCLYPKGLTARVRSIQVHGQRTARAVAGQRTAVNLTGIRREHVSRGDHLAAPDSMEPALMLDVRLEVLPRCGRELKNGSRLHFHQGTGAALCKLVLLDREVLKPGEEAPAQLRFTGAVSVKNGDRFVVRFYSPVETVGGGEVLNCCPRRHKRFDQSTLEGLHLLTSGTQKQKLLQCFYEKGTQPTDPEQIHREVNLPDADFKNIVGELLEEQSLIHLGEGAVLPRARLEALKPRLNAILKDFHRREPMQPGMKREELRDRLLPGWDAGPGNRALEWLIGQGAAEEEGQRLRAPGFVVQLTSAQTKLLQALTEEFVQSGLEPMLLDEIKGKYAGKKELKGALDTLFQRGELVALSAQVAIHRQFFDQAWQEVEACCQERGEVTLAQFRDRLGLSRKYALMLLECFDRRGWTRKTGEARVLIGAK